jgi:uncharacterized protein YndB with AHSA1/START domain
MSDTIERSQIHGTFVVERNYPVPVTSVWHALSDNAARDAWFSAGPEFEAHQRSHDFRVGGQAVEEGQWRDGPKSSFRSTYNNIVDQQRIVFTYDMWLDGRHISTSLTTIVLEPEGEGTRLTYTEQAVHFDGLDSVEAREEGTGGLLDNLGSFLVATH